MNKFNYGMMMSIIDPKRCRLMSVSFKKALRGIRFNRKRPSRCHLRQRTKGMKRGSTYNVGLEFKIYHPSRCERLVWTPRWGLRSGVNPIPVWRAW